MIRNILILLWVCMIILGLSARGASNSAEDSAGADNQVKVMYVGNGEQTDTEENIATDGVVDYPAAIMVNDTVYSI